MESFWEGLNPLGETHMDQETERPQRSGGDEALWTDCSLHPLFQVPFEGRRLEKMDGRNVPLVGF